MDKIKFEIKPPKQKPAAEDEPRQGREEKEPFDKAQDKPETPLEIETWEGEGGTVETQEEAPAEVPETIVEEEKVKTAWQELITQAKEEFPEKIRKIIDKHAKGEKLKTEDWNRLDAFAQLWFREIFGIKVKKKQLMQELPKKKPLPPKEKKLFFEQELVEQERRAEEKRGEREGKRQHILNRLSNQKRHKMENLHNSLRSLDNGEPVNKFRDETRRVVYFDEESKEYFVEEKGARKNIGIGDMVSDHAWGIKYVPDGEMTEPAYRTLAKRILVNETRRDLEKLRNQELAGKKDEVGFSFIRFRNAWENAHESDKENIMGQVGFIAEIEVRELLSRFIYNYNLDLIVSRATIEEDREFKYDFKIRTKHKIRGVDVEGKYSHKSLGIDLKAPSHRKRVRLGKAREGKRVMVDEILILKVPGKKIADAFKKWVSSDEPSGGPEQFLSKELKVAILKAVTGKLTKIPQEVFDKIE